MARHLTYANVMATLALFVALGGGAYAVTALPKNSVTSVQVKNRSLLAKDFKQGQLKPGPRGPAGVDGKDGAPGAAGKDGAAGKNGTNGTNGLDGAPGKDGTNGTNGTNGLDGSAKAYAYISPQGNVAQSGKGITKVTAYPFSTYCIDVNFPVAMAVVSPDVLSGGSEIVSEVQAPSLNTGPCGDQQIYVRIAEESYDQATKTLTRTGYAGGHGFYIEIN